MRQYLDLLRRILDEGEDVQSGAVIKSEDRKATCRMLLGQQMRFDLREGFPIVTTKAVPFDIVVDEVLWFLRGETNIQRLGRNSHTKTGETTVSRFVQRHIWDQWANEMGDVPHIYGESWRRWEYNEHVYVSKEPGAPLLGRIDHWDQIAVLLGSLQDVARDPSNRARRRIILSAWNPPRVPDMGLAPCHTLSQWLPTNGYLDVVCHWRSIDMFLGCPFNIVQYALLAHVFGRIAGLKPRHLVTNIADCHLYDNQFEQVREQIERKPNLPPYLKIDERFFQTAPNLGFDQMAHVDPSWFSLDGYEPHQGRLRAEVAV
jgi:thymidylate synthase